MGHKQLRNLLGWLQIIYKRKNQPFRLIFLYLKDYVFLEFEEVI